MTGDITPPQMRCINTMISKLGLTEQRDDIISGASGERTKSAKDLTKQEAASLITYLKNCDPEEQRAETMRRKIIGMAYEHAGLPRNASKPQKQEVVNRLNDWCVKYGYLHKRLNQYRYIELPMLISQFENVMKSHFKTI